jgi:hypothetical protein
MPIFNAIITNLANAPKASAQLDVSIDTAAGAGAPIDVTVFRSDGTRQDFRILTNDRGFASTAPAQDLFGISGGLTALVQAVTPSGIAAATALLRQKVSGQKIVLGIPPATSSANAALGASTTLSVAIGDIMRGTFLLIGNVTDGQPADVKVFVGSTTTAPRFANPELGVRKVWELALTAAEAQSHLIVQSSVPVVVQLAVDDGKVDEATVVST